MNKKIDFLKKFLLVTSKMYQMCNRILATICYEEILFNRNFGDNLKVGNVTPIYKQNGKTFVENYRPVSVLPRVPKIFEQIIQKKKNIY